MQLALDTPLFDDPGALLAPSLVLAGTGHRPDDKQPWRGVGSWSDVALHLAVQEWILQQLIDLKPTRVISGMAVGVDTWLAMAARRLGIPYTAAVPFLGQELDWPMDSQVLYNELLVAADQVVNTSGALVQGPRRSRVIVMGEREQPFTEELMRYLMDRRNRWMVDNCTKVLSVWDGSPGGTGNCMKYVQKVGRPYVRLDPSKLREAA